MDFNEWFDSQDDVGCLMGLEGYAAEQAWNAQQAKIDAIIKWVEENKKSIPLSEWHGYTTEEYVDADDLLGLLK